jgi:hypothetical protein
MQMCPGLSGFRRKAAAIPATQSNVSIPMNSGLNTFEGALVGILLPMNDFPCLAGIPVTPTYSGQEVMGVSVA